jgi:hypothetical protein
MVFEAFTMVFETETLGWETKAMVSKPETILLATGKMVSLIKKIFCFAKTMVSVIGTMLCVKNTMVPTSEPTVTAAQKMVSFAPTMVCKVLSIVLGIVEQSFANSKLAFLELQPAHLEFEPGSAAEALRVFLPEVMLRCLINPGAIPPILSQCDALLIDKPQRKQEML